MSYNKLFFNAIDLNVVRLQDGLHPHMNCPVCGRGWTPNLSLGTSFPASFDVNRKISFTAPTHLNPKTNLQCGLSGQLIELFVAVHRDANGVRFRIQKACEEGVGGIQADWWVTK
jgi:hypothetical protein